MILAAPLVIPFAKAVGISIATLGMAKAADMVNDYIQKNPEESAMILKTLVPNLGIGQIFMNKEKISLEDLEEMTDEEAQDLSKEDKAELMKQGGKSKSKDKRQTMIDLSEKLGLSSEGKEKQDIEYEIDERYDEGGVEDAPKPKFDYKKFFRNRRADGGAIGIEVLFEEKKPRKDFNTGGRATTQDFANALKSVSAGTTYQQQRQAKDYARQEASNLLSQAMKSGNQSGIQSILQGIGGSTTIPGMQFNKSGNRITSVPATGPGRDKILDAMANQMLSTTSYAAPDPFQKRVDELDAIRAENQRLVNQYMQNNSPSIGIIAGPMGGTPQAPGKPAYEDKTLLNQLTKLTPLQATYFDPFEQLSDIDQYNLSQAFPELQSQLRNTNFVSSSGPLDKQQIFERIYGLKDGGRVGLFMGGPALEGQALNIYESMNKYGFSDQEIADALRARGLYDAAPVETPVVNTAPNIINQNRGGDGPNNPPGPTGPSVFGGLNKDDYEAEAYNIGPTFAGTFARGRMGIQSLISKLRSLPTPLNIALNVIENIKNPYKNPFGGLNKGTRDAIGRDQAATSAETHGGYGSGTGGVGASGPGSGGGYNEGNFCFDPSTPIQMADGSEKKIKEIQLGDNTKGGEVTGVFQFKATDEIHDYKGVTVAGSHYVKEDGKFIMVKDSPLAVKIDKIPVVYSLDTTGRRIFINDIEFADYNGDGVAKSFLTNAGVDITGFDTEVLRQVENRLI